MDAASLARMQFAFTAIYHYLFVPLSIGLGLIVALMQTKAYRTGDAHDEARAAFWVRLFTMTFAVGVATGITMEFSFGTNWAGYSRFVGDIFGAPLAAEALFAFFLESVFLGVLLFGKGRVSRRFYMVSSWLVWAGSLLSSLWIVIANSWMQTPAGYTVVHTAAGSKAELTSFLEAALNHTTLQRFFHTVIALLILGAFVSMAIGAYYLWKMRDEASARVFIRTGAIVGIVTAVLMLPAAHAQALAVARTQPSKLAAMEGQYEEGPVALSLFGWVDEENETTYALSIPGGTSFLADQSFTTEYPGLNDFAPDERPEFVNAIFQSYHAMVALFGVICIALLVALLVAKGKLANKRWPLAILMFAWIAPYLAIEFGWITAELGRQPWIVYGELKTVDAASASVTPAQLYITMGLFLAVYLVVFLGWVRMVAKTIKAGPDAFLPSRLAVAAASEDAPELSFAAAPAGPRDGDDVRDDGESAESGDADASKEVE